MASTLQNRGSNGHRVIPEMRPDMLKADVRKPESADSVADIGECLDYARRIVGWNLEELAGKLPAPPGSDKRDPRQVARWLRGEERTPVDVVFAVEALRAPFVIALAQLAKCEVTTTIAVRRSA